MDPIATCQCFKILQLMFMVLYLITTAQMHKSCICLEEFASDLRDPILAIHANDGTQRLFIAEQIGIIYVYQSDKSRQEEPFLNIQSQVIVDPDNYDERGFLGLAFHPNHSENRKLYVYYTTLSKAGFKVRISEFITLADNINKVDENSEHVILEVEEPENNHNGGQILFGTDGYLYAFLGDGGGGGDRHGDIGNGQNLTTLLAKGIRIDIDQKEGDKQYAIPPDNPFVNGDPTVKRHEIYAYGLRNPWRCSVDRGDATTGKGRERIFCGDVGQDKFEEVDIITNGGNYGWRGKEGYECFDVNLCYDLENEVLPIDVYDHSVGRSITGGYVYRGQQSSSLLGKYIFGDYVNGAMFTLTEDDNKWTREELRFCSDYVCKDGFVNTYPVHILSFGEDESGEVYMLTTDKARAGNPGGIVFRIVDPSGGCNQDENLDAKPHESSIDHAKEQRGTSDFTLFAKPHESSIDNAKEQHDTGDFTVLTVSLIASLLAITVGVVIVLYKRTNNNKEKVPGCYQGGPKTQETTPLISR